MPQHTLSCSAMRPMLSFLILASSSLLYGQSMRNASDVSPDLLEGNRLVERKLGFAMDAPSQWNWKYVRSKRYAAVHPNGNPFVEISVQPGFKKELTNEVMAGWMMGHGQAMQARDYDFVPTDYPYPGSFLISYPDPSPSSTTIYSAWFFVKNEKLFMIKQTAYEGYPDTNVRVMIASFEEFPGTGGSGLIFLGIFLVLVLCVGVFFFWKLMPFGGATAKIGGGGGSLDALRKQANKKPNDLTTWEDYWRKAEMEQAFPDMLSAGMKMIEEESKLGRGDQAMYYWEILAQNPEFRPSFNAALCLLGTLLTNEDKEAGDKVLAHLLPFADRLQPGQMIKLIEASIDLRSPYVKDYYAALSERPDLGKPIKDRIEKLRIRIRGIKQQGGASSSERRAAASVSVADEPSISLASLPVAESAPSPVRRAPQPGRPVEEPLDFELPDDDISPASGTFMEPEPEPDRSMTLESEPESFMTLESEPESFMTLESKPESFITLDPEPEPEPESFMAPEPDGLDFLDETMPSATTYKRRSARIRKLSQSGLTLAVEGGETVPVNFRDISDVAVGVIRDPGQKPYLALGLALDPVGSPVRRIVYLSSRDTPITRLLPRVPADQAWRHFTLGLLKASGARPLPDQAAATGKPYAQFDSLLELEELFG